MSGADEVRKLAREEAERGVADAQVALGVVYLTAQGVERDEEKALSWLLKAADQSDTDALYNLGIVFDTGFFGMRPPDATEALSWFRRAASQGHDGAKYNLGVAYAEGKGVTPDRARAIAWWREAAEAGNARAQYNLGVSYSNGEGVAGNDVQAVAWWEKAAMPPNPAAKPESAYYSAPSGIIVRKGLGDAGRGEHGYADAQYHLARMYAMGRGVARDNARSAEWLRRAAEQGHNGARAALSGRFWHRALLAGGVVLVTVLILIVFVAAN